MTKITDNIKREPVTWITYLMLGYYAFFINWLGPIMPFLQAELKMSYTLSSLHFSAFAMGMVLTGLVGDRIISRFGRHNSFWFGAIGMAGGAEFIMIGFHPAITISGAFLMGTIGSLLLVMIPAILSDLYAEKRSIAISESNVVASICGSLAPISIGLFVYINLKWQWTVIVLIITVATLWFVSHNKNVSFPEPKFIRQKSSGSGRKLPYVFWLYWVLLMFSVSVEFCIIFWSAIFMETVKNFTRADAVFIMSLFPGAMVFGRIMGSRLSRRVSSTKIILGSVVTGIVGFLIHWLAVSGFYTMAGLFLTGLGVANLYPQIISLAVSTGGDQTDLASARASTASGTAILILPFIIGGLADLMGIKLAYGLLSVLFILVGSGILLIPYFNRRGSNLKKHKYII